MRYKKPSLGFAAALAMFAAVPFLVPRASAQTEKVLYSFNNTVVGTDGIQPEGGVTFDTAGNIYGTTIYGGAGTCVLDSVTPGCGTVYELVPQTGGTWTETILHSFLQNGKDGEEPFSNNLVFDGSGNIYGVTGSGGASLDCPTNDAGTSGCGTVFELEHKSSGWVSVILHSFDGNNKNVDGQAPEGTLVFDGSGNLYGTAVGGGATPGDGMAYKLSPEAPPATWYERTMYNFQTNGKDGVSPDGGLIFDTAGNLYGVAANGGKNGNGTVYELIPNAKGWSEKILYTFGTGTDAAHPKGSLIFDTAGNLYGVASGGATNRGTVFELSPATGGTWTEKVLHSFADNGTDGWLPNGTLIRDSSGNLYGTTQFGGLTQCNGGCGTVFELSPETGGTWTETILYSFLNNGADGFYPEASLTFDSSGNLYGTTDSGGVYGNGTVFEVTP